MQPLGQPHHPPKAIMVEALTSWADETGASFARHRENVCALGLGKDMAIEDLTKKVKALEALSAAEEKRGIDLRERTRKCGKMILATGEVVALPRRAGEAVGLAERVSAWRAKLESGQMGVLILQQAMLRDPVWKSTSASGAPKTKSFLGDEAAVLAPSSGEEPASPRHRAGVASMAWRTTRRFSTNAP